MRRPDRPGDGSTRFDDDGRQPGRHRWLPSAAVATAFVLALAVAPMPLATAVPQGDGHADTPSRADVREARQVAAARADEVGQIQGQLALAQQRLQQVQVASMQATEAYNGAVYKLQQARAEARAAMRRAAAADSEAERQRRALEGFAVGSASDATSLTDLTTLLSSGGPEELLQDYGAWSDTTAVLQADLDRWDASRAVAEVMRQQADAARARRADAAADARAARDAAQAAVASAEQQEASIQARTDELVRALAEAQHVSVRLARQRQVGLAEAAAQAAQEAAEQATAEAAADDQPANPQQPGPGGSSGGGGSGGGTGGSGGTGGGGGTAGGGGGGSGDTGGTDGGGTGGGGGGGTPDPPTSPPPPAPSGAGTAIAFAKAQLGEPYVYGAAGPDAWDCSGLTSKAWAAAGHPLSHWSVAQYSETTPITPSQLQAGDLVFWSDGSPSSIYHVAMYLGGGMIIQAPRPGRGVEIVSMYYWITPDLFGRVA